MFLRYIRRISCDRSIDLNITVVEEMINEARNYYSINFVSRFDESPRYWLTDKIDSRKSIGMLSVSLPRSVSSMLFIYSFNFFSLSLQSIPLFLEIWISPPLEAAEISIEEGKERKSIERSSLTPHCCQQSADRKKKVGETWLEERGEGSDCFSTAKPCDAVVHQIALHPDIALISRARAR